MSANGSQNFVARLLGPIHLKKNEIRPGMRRTGFLVNGVSKGGLSVLESRNMQWILNVLEGHSQQEHVARIVLNDEDFHRYDALAGFRFVHLDDR